MAETDMKNLWTHYTNHCTTDMICRRYWTQDPEHGPSIQTPKPTMSAINLLLFHSWECNGRLQSKHTAELN